MPKPARMIAKPPHTSLAHAKVEITRRSEEGGPTKTTLTPTERANTESENSKAESIHAPLSGRPALETWANVKSPAAVGPRCVFFSFGVSNSFARGKDVAGSTVNVQQEKP